MTEHEERVERVAQCLREAEKELRRENYAESSYHLDTAKIVLNALDRRSTRNRGKSG